MSVAQPIQSIVNFLNPAGNILLGTSREEAEAAVRSGDPERVRTLGGQYAIIQAVGKTVRMARTIGRPMRYFLAKRENGPCLIVAERMETIRDGLQELGLVHQFHPSYTRMVPAHHLLELRLIGCPDPNPTLMRFFAPRRNRLSTDLDSIGRQYVGAVASELDRWLDRIEPDEPIGVLFSGGIDSGMLLVLLNWLLLRRGQAPTRLKALTLSVRDESSPAGDRGEDGRQAQEFCRRTKLEMLLEVVEVPAAAVQWREAVRVTEDYKPLDIQAAAMTLALCRQWRRRYPDWKYLVDGDGGDENLKDYPIEDNPELTIRSVLNNRMLYHEGWGVDAIKHSLVYSGGQSRGHIRTFAPAVACGFVPFSPFALPNVIEVAEGIPFIELTQWDHERLYRLKGQVAAAGIRAVTGTDFPVFPKRRFQQGAVSARQFAGLFPTDPFDYRRTFTEYSCP